MKAGDTFEVNATSVNWNIHNNTVTDCQRPVVLNSYGSRTSLFKENLLSRGNHRSSLGVEVHGSFQFLNNRLTGFDEDKASALALFPDAAAGLVHKPV